MYTVSLTSGTVQSVERNKEKGAPLQCTDLEKWNTPTDRYDVVISILFQSLECGSYLAWKWATNICEHFLWIKPTDTLNSNFIGITTLHVSGSLSAHHQEFLAIHRLWYILCSCDHLLPGVGWSSSTLLLVANGSSQLHKMYQSRCTDKNSWWWAGSLPETCRVVIPIKLEFSASVGFIHKESVTMHGHTIVKIC